MTLQRKSEVGFKLPDTVASAQDLTALILEIKSYTKWYLHEMIKLRVSHKKNGAKDEPELSPAASELLREFSKQNPMTRQSLESLIKTLEDYSKHAPVVLFTLAAPVTAGVKKTLVGWCRNNIADNVLVSFQHNSTILGGMVMRYKSRVFDWSFRREILANAHTFPEVLKRV